MMMGVLIAGIFAILAGLLAILYGFLLELSFGNTLILAGAIGVCSGMIVLAQAVVVWELRNIGRRLGPRTAAESRPRPVLAPVGPPIGPGMQDLGAPIEEEPAAASPPWREEAATRDRTRGELPIPPSVPTEVAEPADPPQQRRRNLLFSSSVRKERERFTSRSDEAELADRPAPPAPDLAEAPPASLEDSWPKWDRPRASEASAQRRAMRTPSSLAEGSPGARATADRPVQAARGEEPPAVTVIKSGVVDGMAYSLYSDGSIEAQMPEGMMHFASIDELRAHLDQRS